MHAHTYIYVRVLSSYTVYLAALSGARSRRTTRYHHISYERTRPSLLLVIALHRPPASSPRARENARSVPRSRRRIIVPSDPLSSFYRYRLSSRRIRREPDARAVSDDMAWKLLFVVQHFIVLAHCNSEYTNTFDVRVRVGRLVASYVLRVHRQTELFLFKHDRLLSLLLYRIPLRASNPLSSTVCIDLYCTTYDVRAPPTADRGSFNGRKSKEEKK